MPVNSAARVPSLSSQKLAGLARHRVLKHARGCGARHRDDGCTPRQEHRRPQQAHVVFAARIIVGWPRLVRYLQPSSVQLLAARQVVVVSRRKVQAQVAAYDGNALPTGNPGSRLNAAPTIQRAAARGSRVITHTPPLLPRWPRTKIPGHNPRPRSSPHPEPPDLPTPRCHAVVPTSSNGTLTRIFQIQKLELTPNPEP